MVAAFRIAEHVGVGNSQCRGRAVRLLSGLGLPTDITPYLKNEVFGFMTSDKKRQGDHIRFVVPGDPGKVELRSLPLSEVVGALQSQGR
jgi:3-dehydroquinate synthetase